MKKIREAPISRWYETNPLLYFNEKISLFEHYRHLVFEENEGKIRLTGRLRVIDQNGDEHGNFLVEIVFPDDYPYEFPKVYEKEGKIPVDSARHMNSDGSFALCFKYDEIFHIKKGLKVIYLIETLIIPFLSRQLFFDQFGEWVSGDRLFGDEGIVDFYQKELNTKDLKIISNILETVLTTHKIAPNAPCFCKSGKKFKKCHRELFEHIKMKVPEKDMREDLKVIRKYFE
ncbi:MAG TPA: hypothetical protein DHW82_05860 [Spirochaetia bacterium]|nr:MAG: hypothetical protein A2Y41_04870 [Spirochaetes bacterium GWB1_36_13]HCL56518.1 hypothetical protein [Spirochaetia bacterium]